MKPIRVIELFAGIGAQRQALKDAGVPHESVAIAEIDKHAIRSYMAIHGETPNLGDVSKVDHLPDCDLLTYSFPCQDLSTAGKRAGMTKGSGTRSGLLWEVERLLLDMRERERLPKYLLMENVESILFEQNISDFSQWVRSLTDMGYTSSYAVLNSTQFDIPQNRKRCFMVSILRGPIFKFPRGEPLTKCLKDLLEEDVGEEFYLPEERTEKFQLIASNLNKAGLGKPVGYLHYYDYKMLNFVYSSEGVSPPVRTFAGGDNPIKIYSGACRVCGLLEGGYDIANRVYDPEATSPTIPVFSGACPIIKHDRIRHLTPRECWRLQGQPDSNYDKAVAVGMSKAQLYKQAGNSITVNVLTAIFRELFPEGGYKGVRCTLDMF